MPVQDSPFPASPEHPDVPEVSRISPAAHTTQAHGSEGPGPVRALRDLRDPGPLRTGRVPQG